MNMYHLVSQTLAYQVEGDLVEVGCNAGQSAVLIAKVMRDFASDKKLHVYDSFEGLPPTKVEDGTVYKEGDLAVSEETVRKNFLLHDLKIPAIHKGWFEDTLPATLPAKVSFAHLDGDLYDSIMVSLKYVYPRLTRGAICLVDDYCDPQINPDGWNYLPGVKKACDEFLSDKPERICYPYSGVFTHFLENFEAGFDADNAGRLVGRHRPHPDYAPRHRPPQRAFFMVAIPGLLKTPNPSRSWRRRAGPLPPERTDRCRI